MLLSVTSSLVLPTYLVYRYDLGLYWAWACASLYLVVLSMIFLRRFLRGAWKEMRIIGPTHDPVAPDSPSDEADGEKFALERIVGHRMANDEGK